MRFFSPIDVFDVVVSVIVCDVVVVGVVVSDVVVGVVVSDVVVGIFVSDIVVGVVEETTKLTPIPTTPMITHESNAVVASNSHF